MLQKGETALLTGSLKREAQKLIAIQDLGFVFAGKFLLYKPKLNLFSLDFADVSAGCV